MWLGCWNKLVKERIISMIRWISDHVGVGYIECSLSLGYQYNKIRIIQLSTYHVNKPTLPPPISKYNYTNGVVSFQPLLFCSYIHYTLWMCCVSMTINKELNINLLSGSAIKLPNYYWWNKSTPSIKINLKGAVI